MNEAEVTENVENLPPLFPNEAEITETELRGEDQEVKEPAANIPDRQEPASVEKQTQSDTSESDPVDFDALEQESELYQQLSADTDTGDFKELSQEEFEKLNYEDPDEALKYLYRQTRHKERQQRNASAQSLTNRLIQDSMSEIEEMVPGIYSGASEKSSELANFAVRNGMDAVFLNLLTSPNTRLIPPGSDKPILLGRGAARLVRLISNLHGKVNAKQSSQAPKKRETSAPKAESAVQKDLSGPIGLQLEKDYSRMDKAEREKYLKGE